MPAQVCGASEDKSDGNPLREEVQVRSGESCGSQEKAASGSWRPSNFTCLENKPQTELDLPRRSQLEDTTTQPSTIALVTVSSTVH